MIALPSLGWVARIATAPDALDRIAASVRVTRWLAARGYSCVRPVDSVEQPFVARGRVVSIWHLEPTVDAPVPSGADLGRLLRELHAQPVPPFPLSRFIDPFDDVAAALAQTPDAMRPAQRAWLLARITDLRLSWPRLPFTNPWGLIHGDAHPNNEMRTLTGSVVLGDWDHTAIGPREWDLAQVHYTRRRFQRPEAAALDDQAASYGWDIREWEGLDTVIAAREITGLSPYIRTAPVREFSHAELGRRLDILHDGDTVTKWTSPTRN
ncbi:aminoglycoside phosphotransferase family protein [Streptomyces sp. NPDC026672]|uniref:aminoglycoside phosphotransferase family protein n=1 Tax=unclassified Streptomyces TaxID=2593676 RepID=UPI0033D75B81